MSFTSPIPTREFRATSMKAVLELVRAELGEDAVIVRTRQVEKPRMPWQKKEVETIITAALDETVLPVSQRQPSRLPSRFDDSDFAPLPEQQAKAINRRFDPPQHMPTSKPVKSVVPVLAAQTDNQQALKLEDDLKSRLSQLQSIVDRLSQQVQGSSWPVEFEQLAEKLRYAHLPPQALNQVLQQLNLAIDPTQYHNTDLLNARLKLILESQLRTGGTIHLKHNQPQVVALIGPTGVGKTTTIAKLAANFHLKDGLKLGLITIDTYRIAAVDQLKTYAEILNVPMQVVSEASQLQQAIRQFQQMDLILIDTAGRSPLEESQITELEHLFSQCAVDQIHLVLSLTTDHRQLSTISEKFRSLKPTACIVSKLDEAPAMGGLLSISQASGLPISYLTTGQNVPDDIEVAHKQRCVERILNHSDLLHSFNRD